LPDTRSAARELETLLSPDDVVLLKGSRAAGIEQLAEALAR
jgi:UDP-N-acetylmuramyl pentapeptide synthase